MIATNMPSRGTPPKTLYRFFDENGLKTLVDGTLKLTPPREFNDPFETLPGLRAGKDYSDDEIREYFLTPNSWSRKIRTDDFVKMCGREPTDAELEKWVERVVLPTKQLFWTHMQGSRDAFHNTTSKFFGLVCFAALDDEEIVEQKSITMWSHYAKDHTGLAIGFNGAHKAIRQFASQTNALLFRVGYSKERPICEPKDFLKPPEDASLDILYRWSKIKAKVWESENEWRLIFPLHPVGNLTGMVHQVAQIGKILYLVKLWSQSQIGPALFPDANVIRTVILGARSSMNLRVSASTVLNQKHLQHVDLYQAELDEHEFKLRLALIRPGQRS